MMKKNILSVLCFCVFILLGSLVLADDAVKEEFVQMESSTVSLEYFKTLSILDEGRIKPVDTFARNFLFRLSGRKSFQRQPAVHWFAQVLFDPESTFQDKVFLVNNPDVAVALGIVPDEKRKYSFVELEKNFDRLEQLAMVAHRIDEKKRDTVEQEILRVYENVRIYSSFVNALSFTVPNIDFKITNKNVIKFLDLDPSQEIYSFADVVYKGELLQKKIMTLDMNDLQSWSAEEQEYFYIVNHLYQWTLVQSASGFYLFPNVDENDDTWLTPWNALSTVFYEKGIQDEIRFLKDMAVYYREGKQIPFDLAVRSLKTSVFRRVSKEQKNIMKKSGYEILYNERRFFFWAGLLYGGALIVFLISLFVSHDVLRKISFTSLLMGAGVHVVGIAMRIIILSRPPVSSLYDTFVFVALITVVMAIIVEKVNKDWLGIIVGSISAIALLFIAAKYSAEGDTLKMLVAVLDSNFWLTIHVLSISIGYAGCCIAGLIGHVYILQRLFKPHRKDLHRSTFHNIMGTLCFGLMMTFWGTVLGGIWADQSWGRFWGWDPKENGALLIVLWCAIILHARMAGWIKSLGVAVGSALGIVVVMWAWFGVNLLGIGLHSYGFTTGIARNLLIYIICEVVFLCVCTYMIRCKEKIV